MLRSITFLAVLLCATVGFAQKTDQDADIAFQEADNEHMQNETAISWYDGAYYLMDQAEQ